MAVHTEAGAATATIGRERRVARWVFVGFAAVLVASVIAQVFLAGLALMSDSDKWSWHVNFVHVFEALPWFMLILAWVGRLRLPAVLHSLAIGALIGLQYALVQMQPEWPAALHVVNALLIFWLSLAVLRYGVRGVRSERAPEA